MYGGQKMYDSIEKGDLSVGIFLDLCKAFDTIDYDILFHKLYFYGMDWFRTNLYEGKQYVPINGKESPGVNTGAITLHHLYE